MSFLDQVWNKILPIYNSIKCHPFNLKLVEGGLEQEAFVCYLVQIKFLMTEFLHAMSIVLAKSGHSSIVADLLRSMIAESENELTMCNKSLPYEDYYNETSKMLPMCAAYANFITARAAMEDIPVAISVVVPRFFLNHQFVSTISKINNYYPNLYSEWLEIYGSNTFIDFIDKAKSVLNEIARDQSPLIAQRMEEGFIHSSLFQWHLIQEAYNNNNIENHEWDRPNLLTAPRKLG